MTRTRLSAAEARRIAIAAQGLDRARLTAPTLRDIRRTIGKLGLLQIDSVNVLVRAHYMPLFSRLGAYQPVHLETDAGHGTSQPRQRTRRLFEYWAHEASLVPVEMYPLFRWRMAAAERGEDLYGHLARFASERRPFVNSVLGQVRSQGAMAASEFAGGSAGAGGWWGWSDAKTAVEWLFWTGQLTTSRREVAGFTRIYDLTERVLPDAVFNAPEVPRDEAQRQLLRHAIRALGVATEIDLRDYFRLPVADTKARIAELTESGDLMPVVVEGWNKPAWLDPSARIPHRIDTHGLLSPFDPLVWERRRSERLFDFHYRLEIYTPAAKRQFGYYCLPFRLDDRIVARLDLKADRASSTLRVEAAHGEVHAAPGIVAEALAIELALMAKWLGLAQVWVGERGDLARPLRSATAAL